jgi:hypothetical protein
MRLWRNAARVARTLVEVARAGTRDYVRPSEGSPTLMDLSQTRNITISSYPPMCSSGI